MTTLAEIERAADALPQHQQEQLLERLAERIRRQRRSSPPLHSVLDIAPVSLGQAIRPLSADDDLLGELMEMDYRLKP
jgi:hypothetical protein